MFEKIKWIGILLCLMGIIYGSHWLSMAVTTTLSQEPMVIVVDAGHGGADPGKVGVNQVLEKEINLAIAKELKDALEKNGFRVVMTREEDQALAETKKEDMKVRVDTINESGAMLAVSIHQNSFSDENQSGAQVFYHKNAKQGKMLAETLQGALRQLDPDNKREKKANESYFLLKYTDVPIVIIECGFLSNWEEAEHLKEASYQTDIANAICDGILQYIATMELEE